MSWMKDCLTWEVRSSASPLGWRDGRGRVAEEGWVISGAFGSSHSKVVVEGGSVPTVAPDGLRIRDPAYDSCPATCLESAAQAIQRVGMLLLPFA